MKILKYLNQKSIQTFGIGLIVFFALLLNLYILNQIITKAGSDIEFKNSTNRTLY